MCCKPGNRKTWKSRRNRNLHVLNTARWIVYKSQNNPIKADSPLSHCCCASRQPWFGVRPRFRRPVLLHLALWLSRGARASPFPSDEKGVDNTGRDLTLQHRRASTEHVPASARREIHHARTIVRRSIRTSHGTTIEGTGLPEETSPHKRNTRNAVSTRRGSSKTHTLLITVTASSASEARLAKSKSDLSRLMPSSSLSSSQSCFGEGQRTASSWAGAKLHRHADVSSLPNSCSSNSTDEGSMFLQ